MIAERLQQGYNNTKYYQFVTILEHVIDCFQSFVSDEANLYHPPLGWLTRKQPKPPDEELFTDLMDECSLDREHHRSNNYNAIHLSFSVRTRLERSPKESRAEIVRRTRDGCTPLFAACHKGLTDVVRYLLDVCGADIDQKGRYETIEDQHVHLVPPIWVAAVSGHYATVQLLIERGADVNSLSDTGSTPLRSVCYLCKDNDDIPSSSSGQFEVEVSFSTLGNDIFSIAGETSEKQSEEDPYFRIVQLLVENGANVSKPNHNGGTCLINSLHNYRLTEYILDRGVDVNASDNNGKTALHYAINYNRLNVTKLLLARGANPRLRTNSSEDALQLSCISGNEEIFNHLIKNYNYSYGRLSDAYKLLGSSILELHYDISRVRSLWLKSIELHGRAKGASQSNCDTGVFLPLNRRRSIAYNNIEEFVNQEDLSVLTADQFRIQSLLISERILGPTHRETIQRILCRGSAYISSMRPDRCIDLWIYALSLLLEHESIFNFETLLGARAFKKLLLDLLTHNPRLVKFNDVYDVLNLIISHDRLSKTVASLQIRPRSCLHEDIFNLLLLIIINLLLVARSIANDEKDFLRLNRIVEQLVKLNPKTSDGSSLIHLCATSNIFEGEAYRSIIRLKVSSSSPQINASRTSPVFELIRLMLDAGLEPDQVNDNKLSPLQVFCLSSSSIRAKEKWKIIKLLVDRGAHIDRKTATNEQSELIKTVLRESGIVVFNSMRLSCLAARQISKSESMIGNLISKLPKELRDFVDMH